MAVSIKNLSKKPIFIHFDGVSCRFLTPNESTSGLPESLIDEQVRRLAAQKVLELREVDEPRRRRYPCDR